MIGIYHSFVRGHNRDTRVHKLFIIVSGGCGKAADELYNCVLDCHGHATAKDCAMSEEAWWLRRASYRSRCRLIAECASAFGIKVNNIRDIHAYESVAASACGSSACGSSACGSLVNGTGGVRVAVPTIDTVTHDMCVSTTTSTNDTVHLFDGCTNVNNIRNGLLCSMHPSEGFWIFKGSQNRAQGANSYGMAWHAATCNRAVGMPTSVIKIHYNDVVARKARVTESNSSSNSTTGSNQVSAGDVCGGCQ